MSFDCQTVIKSGTHYSSVIALKWGSTFNCLVLYNLSWEFNKKHLVQTIIGFLKLRPPFYFWALFVIMTVMVWFDLPILSQLSLVPGHQNTPGLTQMYVCSHWAPARAQGTKPYPALKIGLVTSTSHKEGTRGNIRVIRLGLGSI